MRGVVLVVVVFVLAGCSGATSVGSASPEQEVCEEARDALEELTAEDAPIGEADARFEALAEQAADTEVAEQISAVAVIVSGAAFGNEMTDGDVTNDFIDAFRSAFQDSASELREACSEFGVPAEDWPDGG